QMDTAAVTNDHASIVTAITTDTTATNSTTTWATSAGNFRWNNSNPGGGFLCSRMTGNAYSALLVGLQNTSGANQTAVNVSYDFNLHIPTGQDVKEDPNGVIPDLA